MIQDNDKRIRIIQEKLDFYNSKKVKVHIKKFDGEFLNGILVEKESDRVWIIQENKFGLMHIFVPEISNIEEYKSDQKLNSMEKEDDR